MSCTLDDRSAVSSLTSFTFGTGSFHMTFGGPAGGGDPMTGPLDSSCKSLVLRASMKVGHREFQEVGRGSMSMAEVDVELYR